MGFLSSLDISASGLTAQRLRMDVISENIANIDTTRTDSGEPYRRKYIVLSEKNKPFSSYLENGEAGTSAGGVYVSRVGEDQSDFTLKYDPNNVDADENGYVKMPNVDLSTEMVDMMSAYRSYEANVTAFNASKDMAVKALEIGE
ncbi:flagellar basal body rod protein FlgC [Papillibacter cinnamivorans]|uniref:Flagellar basal-body rod protein FlgC n=1 Tax=Papillibacter cinnamivorans DSM 12816 TaxID=1122930 RepID=A0A1W1YGQ6_9FIRM|nr:flagellar basal body rod protein FlgC [Papillibacter cinnamivorans]SMC35355.1 flagellar basal-body rod protein FlgC [Papillibacter cinnamivorans DSM 12816]